ncbi:helix-turn-helix transcriptional regulator [Bacillus thuringiensis]|uniref:Helix-turn-helix family protein n=1 Tax=Bacillus thuringiensis TaxID=1428 RepID=A0A0B5NWJ2_BACTU|nr:helix-turn-helix transcriptional regulator [Bacillus thuringiensis]MCU5427599.1 helix-turn-helix domain-containing protein [Bacillus cereus]AJG78376.1 helix-turn-helix family protein [Bacillus thuringiensis]EEM78215.1 Transcriptional regulator, MerR [Bacillus thuringiensis serovar pondicheriensis BGSC 4BA1]MDA1815493.1 helix-turn-helix transcriptional regulator [Bacillus cereus]OTX45183.1 transcriptional regulator [Bacillus thuringiensis serovar pondicheriensis]
MNTFGENLKKFRNNRSLTQAEFGDKVQLSRSQISNLETNFNEPDLDSLDRIASFFDISVDTLMGRKFPKSERQLEDVLDEIQTVFAGLDESQREQFCKQLVLYAKFLKNHNELL